MKHSGSALRSSFMLVLLLSILLGVIYPLLVTVISQSVFYYRANGSMLERGGKVVGSTLLGQEFTETKYFWGRLSATTPVYNPASSSGSNFSPNNPTLLEAAKARVAALHKVEPQNKELIPVDLVTASASGLDPHISVAAAKYQLHRVAKARGMKEEDVQALVKKYTETSGFGLIGTPSVNVVRLNLGLDEAEKDSAKEKR